jgi:putative MATE family efflux protein
MSAVSVGSAVLVAQAIGARNLTRASSLAKQALVWSIILSIPLSLIGEFNAHSLVSIFGMDAEVSAIGAAYLRVTMVTVVVLVMLIIGGGVLRGAGDSRTPMLVTALANVVNVVLAYGLIFGKFGLPALGVIGSAWATFAARALALVLLLIVLWRGRNGVSIRGAQGWLPDWTIGRQMLAIGVPAAVEQVPGCPTRGYERHVPLLPAWVWLWHCRHHAGRTKRWRPSSAGGRGCGWHCHALGDDLDGRAGRDLLFVCRTDYGLF